MMRSVCQTASTRKHEKIISEDIEYAVKQQQFSFERFIPEEHYAHLYPIRFYLSCQIMQFRG
ncbi:MAG: hypothetical protein V7K41_31245 [Nostoc sp.]|uniref:hypothetical protein n=1 Tax=Nostoc sp. TaxID=1180 RepID=UPI002FFBE51B